MSLILKGIDKSKYARTFRIYPSGKVLELNDEGLLDNENPYQAIQIPTPHGRLANDIKKMTAFIEPCMIIASTYDEQIERAEAVKKWLLSIIEAEE